MTIVVLIRDSGLFFKLDPLVFCNDPRVPLGIPGVLDLTEVSFKPLGFHSSHRYEKYRGIKNFHNRTNKKSFIKRKE